MKNEKDVAGVKAVSVRTIVLGSGAAALNAAALLKRGGENDLVIVTDGFKWGTSRNTGSDKQTYYKLSLSGGDSDSIRNLASDLFNGRCVDGDIALVEASLSAQSFLRLSDLGVPFPTNRYGEYVGYKTDHDPYRRATSAGPYTSRFMTECLENEVLKQGIEVLDGWTAVRILVRDKVFKGLVVVHRMDGTVKVILANTLVLGTGGPAGIYEDSVYPHSQFGATGIAFECGCIGKNLTEWQYGLASVKPRWNVSGSFMQVLPRFVSIDSDGNEHEFLSDYACPKTEMLSHVFLKGYQWPFDVRKLAYGSSIVDVLCYLEKEKGRKVCLDYMNNPGKEDIPWDGLSQEAREYLEKAGATGKTPIERLKRLNYPAYSFYQEKGVDLAKDYLEISLCAQHNNGGLSINSWWESNIEGIFPVGEVAASHGVYRPGGSALNAGRCGSRRAALWILKHRVCEWTPSAKDLENDVLEISAMVDDSLTGSIDSDALYKKMKGLMSRSGSAIRNKGEINRLIADIKCAISNFKDVRVGSRDRIWNLFQFRNALLTQYVYLSAMTNYIDNGGKSRGSSLYHDEYGSVKPDGLDARFSYSLEDDSKTSEIQEVLYKGLDDISFSWRLPRPIPMDDDFFENVWARYREDGCVY